MYYLDDKTIDSYIYCCLILWMHVSLKFLEYTCAGGPESTVPRTQKTKLYRRADSTSVPSWKGLSMKYNYTVAMGY